MLRAVHSKAASKSIAFGDRRSLLYHGNNPNTATVDPVPK
jgi:hypothetical protein